MKNFIVLLAITMATASCKKEELTPCGNEVDNFAFTSAVSKTDSSIIVQNLSDRDALVFVRVYQGWAFPYSGPEPQDTVYSHSSREILFSEVKHHSSLYSFSDTVSYDSIVVIYSPYSRGCSRRNGVWDWEWSYAPGAKTEKLP